MILGSGKIQDAMSSGDIIIDPYDESRLNPNSYNLRLHNELLMIKDAVLDMKEPTPYEKILIPETGYLLEPGTLYLGRTYELTITKKYVPIIEGRSSIGRLGIFIHATAGFGDIGFSGYWTLEITVVQPIKIYPMIDICQIYYSEISGSYKFYEGKYQHNHEIQISKLYKEFIQEEEENKNEGE